MTLQVIPLFLSTKFNRSKLERCALPLAGRPGRAGAVAIVPNWNDSKKKRAQRGFVAQMFQAATKNKIWPVRARLVAN